MPRRHAEREPVAESYRFSQLFVPLTHGLTRRVDDIDERDHMGGFVDEVVEHVFQDETSVDCFAVEPPDHRECLRMSFKRGGALLDRREPVAGSVGPSVVSNVTGYLTKRAKSCCGEYDLVAAQSSTPNSAARLWIASLAGTPGSPAL